MEKLGYIGVFEQFYEVRGVVFLLRKMNNVTMAMETPISTLTPVVSIAVFHTAEMVFLIVMRNVMEDYPVSRIVSLRCVLQNVEMAQRNLQNSVTMEILFLVTDVVDSVSLRQKFHQ